MTDAWIVGIVGTVAGLVIGVTIGLGVFWHRATAPRCPYCRRTWAGAGRGSR